MPPKRKSDGPDASAVKKGKKNAPETPADPVLEETLQRKIETRSKRWSKVSASKNLDVHYLKSTKDPAKAYSWKTFCKPGGSKDPYDDEEEEDEEEEEGTSATGPSCDGGKKCPCNKPADDLPSHPYVFTHASMIKQNVASNMLDLRDPDSFEMYTYNDHASYGALEVLRNLMLDFDEAYRNHDWPEMWVVVETIPLFMLFGGGDMVCMCDDGATVQETVGVLLRAPLAAIAALEAHGGEEAAWQPRNVGWILSLWHDLARRFNEQSLLDGEPKPSKAKTFKWAPNNFELYTVATAKRRGIKLVDVSESFIQAIPETTMPSLDKPDPWGWSAAFKRIGGGGRSFGGDALDVTSWSAADRKAAAFKKGKDPITPSMMKQIGEGMLMMRG
ncbi:hypothetical protein NLU13_4699 [Sarocladium strictum]|uniref:Uncharacterized protein n=1 Tax=Sarocladium strictum TaxID=5046 RepID=A0AA39GJD8_SARSR|nr:hypothetical protein NLU13_4699 [Sarocladium strictum]